jgi:hypothetical protein
MSTDWKSIIIGVLVAFLTLDIMVSFSSKNGTNVLEKTVDSMSTTSGVVAVVVSLMVGALCWYLSSRNTRRNAERYGIKY